MEKNTKILIGILFVSLIIPLISNAFSFDEFFQDFEEWISSDANGTQIQNEVNVQTNTGGNVVSDGEVIEGESKSEIHIKNVINGTEVDPVDIETQASEVKVESEIKTEDDTVTVQRDIEIDSEKKTENYEVELNQSNEVENKEGGTLETVEDWWSNLVADVSYFFKNIFNLF
jgi:hypothetical protein